MSLFCYDFEMWNIITLSAILTVCLVGMISMVYGEIPPTDTHCLKYHSDSLIIIDLICDESNDAVTYYSNQGYEIKATISTGTNSTMYMQKVIPQ
ncbi:hypothetical protein BH18THE1_BH18THE1_02920 [soil metagenome]